jgi:adenylate cyclase class 2
MREVEVKFRVADVADVVACLRLRDIHFDAPVVQDDQAYAPVGWSYGDSRVGVSFVRLRSVGGVHTFTVKRPLENVLSCAEHETRVDDRDEMHEAILAMGFYPTVRIVKARRSARVDGISICLDEVDGLGWFLELERIVGDDGCGELVQDELVAYVADLDIDAERTVETYDSLVRAALVSTYDPRAAVIVAATASTTSVGVASRSREQPSALHIG